MGLLIEEKTLPLLQNLKTLFWKSLKHPGPYQEGACLWLQSQLSGSMLRAPSLFPGCRLSLTAASRRRLATVTALLWWQLFGLWGIGGRVTNHSEQTEKMEVRISADLWYGTTAIPEGNERCWVGWALYSCSHPLQCLSEDKSGATEMCTLMCLRSWFL